MRIKPIILCGGSGTRLWPLSTSEKPKQFQSLTSEKTMITLTAERLGGDDAPFTLEQLLIVGSQRHAELLQAQLPGAFLVLEPFGRNSAPAVAAACLCADPDDMLLVLPADHHIEAPDKFTQAIAAGYDSAKAGAIVTFGIEPSFPSTGYGYIQAKASSQAVKDVIKFVEKPARETAEAYIEAGTYYWNAGIFLFQAKTMLAAFERFAPDILAGVKRALGHEIVSPLTLKAEPFASVPDISLDYAIMEHVKPICLVPVDMGWNDVGGYQALWDLSTKDQFGNAKIGPVFTELSGGNFIRSEGPRISISGLTDMIVVARPDQVMISSRHDPDAVKRLGQNSNIQRENGDLTEANRELARKTLWRSFETWSKIAWDAEGGGFVESISLSGHANPEIARRVRVQARQIFSFSEAVRLGWSGSEQAERLARQGLDYLDTVCRSDDGGWQHTLASDKQPANGTRDLYDHAFIMLAGAAFYRAFGDHKGLAIATEAHDYVTSELITAGQDGFVDAKPCPGYRRSNPHMHLLEAYLELYQATQNPAWKDAATGIVSLFERLLFDPDRDLLPEYFSIEWDCLDDDKGRIFEPGHHYEWAVLLARYDAICARDTGSWRRRLIATADRSATSQMHGFASNSVDINGRTVDPNCRLWPQLEKFRAELLHPGSTPPGTVNRTFANVFETFISPMPDGLFIDEIDPDRQVIAQAVPASMLYHLVTAFRDII